MPFHNVNSIRGEMDSNVCSLWALEHNWVLRPQPPGPLTLLMTRRHFCACVNLSLVRPGRGWPGGAHLITNNWAGKGRARNFSCSVSNENVHNRGERSREESVIADLFQGLWSKFALYFYWPVNWETATFCPMEFKRNPILSSVTSLNWLDARYSHNMMLLRKYFLGNSKR